MRHRFQRTNQDGMTHRRAFNRLGRCGTSLVEILLGLVLFVIAGVGILGAHLAMSSLADATTHTMRAVSDLQNLAEHIHATDFVDVAATFPAGVADGGGAKPYATLLGGYSLSGEQITVTYPNQTADRLEILITLNWVERSRNRNAVFSTIRTRG